MQAFSSPWRDSDHDARPTQSRSAIGIHDCALRLGGPTVLTLLAVVGVVGARRGVQFALMFWAATFLEEDTGLSRETAAAAVSLFLVGMLTGMGITTRLALGGFPSQPFPGCASWSRSPDFCSIGWPTPCS